jgi:ribosomal protection tetracycline resistance protein
VERALRVLDGVVLVVSAVEGVQSQTRRLARAARAAGLPMLLFVNKIDRVGARDEALLADVRRVLRLRVVAMNAATGLGSRAATVASVDRDDPAWREPLTDLLAECDERVIEAFDRGELDRTFLEAALRAQVAAGAVVPAYFGSAMTGAGLPDLLAGIAEWLPPACGAADAPLAGTVFKIARRPSGEKVVYARIFAGSLAVRERIALHRRDAFGELEQFAERLTGIDRFVPGSAAAVEGAAAGDVVALHGMRSARIGDRLGPAAPRAGEDARAFPPPALESVVHPLDPAQITRLRAALEELAEQDPHIALRHRNDEGEISLRLYGEVQKEIVAETLARDYGIGVAFGPTRTVCIERPLGRGEHAELIGADGNPFYATLGFRIEPGEPGGVRYVRELGALPLAFYRAVEETVHDTLAQGLCGWEVTDCQVTLTAAGFSSVMSTAGDFRKLTPLVLMEALRRAGTEVCEPLDELELEIPEDTFGAVCGALLAARAAIRTATLEDSTQRVICQIPVAELRGFEQRLPGLTRGEGGWLASFAGYVPIAGDPPTRRRVGPNPLNRAHYLADVARA